MKITENDIVIEMAPYIEEDFRDFCIVVKAVRCDWTGTNVKDELLESIKVKELVEAKLKWLSTWKGWNNENGQKYKMLEEILNEAKNNNLKQITGVT